MLKLLDAADVEVRCATLLVLTHLRSADPAVARSVTKALRHPNVVLRDFALGYFEVARPPDALAEVLFLLDTEDNVLRQRVIDVVAGYGNAGVVAVRRVMHEGPRRRLLAAIAVFAGVRSKAALDALFGLLDDQDLDKSRAACDAILTVIPDLDRRGRDDLFVRAGKLVGKKGAGRGASVGGAKILGALSEPRARAALFRLLERSDLEIVRSHSLVALQSCLRDQKLESEEIGFLLPFLEEQDDEAGILRPVVHLLEDQDLGRTHLPLLQKLAEGGHPLVKRFAVQKLGGFDSSAVVHTLIGYLNDDSYARRKQAAASLKTLPAARLALMKGFLACEDERQAWTLQEVLLAHDRSWRRPQLDALEAKLAQARDHGSGRLYAPYFDFLHELDADALGVVVRARAESHRRAKRFAECAGWLALLKDGPSWDEDVQFTFAIATLKSHKVKMTGPARRQDAALETLCTLADSPFPLTERMRRERVLTPEELYFAAFHLAERRGEGQIVGRELLEHVVAKHGRTKAGKAARNKLKLMSA